MMTVVSRVLGNYAKVCIVTIILVVIMTMSISIITATRETLL